MNQQDYDEFFERGDVEYLEEIPPIDQKLQTHQINRSVNQIQQTSWNSFNDRMSSGGDNELIRQQQSYMASLDYLKDGQDLNHRDPNFNPYFFLNQNIDENNTKQGRSNGLQKKKETTSFINSREVIRNSHNNKMYESNFLRKSNDNSNVKSMKYSLQSQMSSPSIKPLKVFQEEQKIRSKSPSLKDFREKDANVVKKPVKRKLKTYVLNSSVSVPKLKLNSKLQNIPFKPKKSAGEQQQYSSKLQNHQFSATPQSIGFFISPSKSKHMVYQQPITSNNNRITSTNQYINSENSITSYQENGLQSVKNSLRSYPLKAKKKSQELVTKNSQLNRQRLELDSSQDSSNNFENPSFPIIEGGEHYNYNSFREQQFTSNQEQQQDRYSIEDIYQIESDSQFMISSQISQMISGTDDFENNFNEGANNQLSSSSGFSDSHFETAIFRVSNKEPERIDLEDFDERTIPSPKSFLNSESGKKYSSFSKMTSVSIEQDQLPKCSYNDKNLPQQINHEEKNHNHNHKGYSFYQQYHQLSQPMDNLLKEHIEHNQLGLESSARLSKTPSKKDIRLHTQEKPIQRSHTPRNKSEERKQMKQYIKILEETLEGKRIIINHLMHENKYVKSKQAPLINGQSSLQSMVRRLQETNNILIDRIKEQNREKSIYAEQLTHKSAEFKILKQKYSETKKKLKQKARTNSEMSKEIFYLKGLLPSMILQLKDAESEKVTQQQQNIRKSSVNERPKTRNSTPTSVKSHTTLRSVPAVMTTQGLIRQQQQNMNEKISINFLSPSYKSIPKKILKKKRKANSSTKHTSEK